MKTSISALSLLISLFVPCAMHGQQTPFPFRDDFESGMRNWVTNGTWGVSTATANSPTHAVADSPGSYYTNNTASTMTLALPISFATAARPAVGFWYESYLEAGYDAVHIEVSTDGGANWTTPLASITGINGAMTYEQVDLGAYAGKGNVKIRFRLATDQTVVMDGVYLDDIYIGDAPAPVVQAQPTAVHANSVELAWSQSAASDFALYRIYRSESAGVDWHTDALVGEVSNRAITGFVDVTACPKSTYFYKVMVVNAAGLHSMSNEIQAQTLAGTDYPFLDNGEGGSRGWIADFPWALSDEDSASPSNAWSDSPGGNYADGIDAVSLTLAGPMRFAGKATTPVLSFNHKFEFGEGDFGNVEASINGGADWSSLWVIGASSGGEWRRARVDMSAYASRPSVLIRFRLTSSYQGNADGWHIDDISVAESPTVVQAPILDQVASHSIRLTWQKNADIAFSHYAIFRSTSPGVGINSTLAGVVNNQNTTSFVDTGLVLDTVYYYRVYAVNPHGTYSPDSVEETSIRTLNNPVPFTADFERPNWGLEWKLVGPWGVTDLEAHGGAGSLTDSPGTVSGNLTCTAETAVDLRGTTWPVLRFWERYTLSAGECRWVDISTDGQSWGTYFGWYGGQSDWVEQQIDLSPWKGQPNVRLRFRISTTASDSDGWYIDDVSVGDHTPLPTQALPFFEGFENGLAGWINGGWAADTTNPKAGLASAYGITAGASPMLVLDRELDLAGTVNPQVTFWVAGSMGGSSGFYPQLSNDGGLTWSDIGASIGTPWWTGWGSDWTRLQVSLSSYWAGQKLRLRFVIGGSASMRVDKLSVQELPAPVVLEQPTPHLKTVDLEWGRSGLGGKFQRYEVYRYTAPNMGGEARQIGVFTDAGRTTLTDTGLLIGATYYYRVFVVDTNDTYSVSNERDATTVPLAFPMVDNMENLDQWVATGSWGVDPDSPHEGAGSLSDSPGVDQLTSQNGTYIMTAVNLAGTQWPVLRFWDRHEFAGGDWGQMQLSTDGSGWSAYYMVTGARSEWAEQVIDLSPWRNVANLRIRFQVGVGTGGGEGWNVDKLSIEENAGGIQTVPFYEGFENGLAGWINGGWDADANNPKAGLSSAYGAVSGITEIMVLGKELDLAGTVNPQLTFWLAGSMGGSSGFYPQVSTDGGLSWSDIGASIGTPWWTGWSSDWMRTQVSLSNWAGQRLRFRFVVSGTVNMHIDKLSVQEMPAPVVLEQPTPHLKTVDLEWGRSGLGGKFQRYEVYRYTAPNMGGEARQIGVFTDAGQTTLTDTGLLIGATYYYRVFVVDTNDTYSVSNERDVTTLVLAFPVVDNMESLDQWVATGTWGVDAENPHEGAGSLSDSPGLDQTGAQNGTYIRTAVNLSGTQWPVLRFWDRHALAGSDWGQVQLSTDGSGWGTYYTVYGDRADWAEQVIDLSPWRNVANLRICFVVGVGTGYGDGWFVDKLSIEENAGGIQTVPFYEGFENGLAGWINGGWVTDASNPKAGLSSAYGAVSGTTEIMVLDKELDLAGTVNPQLTFWLAGSMGGSSGFYPQVSTDGGLSWSDIGASIGTPWWTGWSSDWSRTQVSLANWAGQKLRFRFVVSGTVNMRVDKLSVQELPPPVVLDPLSQITTASMRLSWTQAAIPNFGEYRVYRSDNSTVTEGSTLIAVIKDKSATSWVDWKLQSRKTHYYKVFLYDSNDTSVGSNQSSATTMGVPVPWSESFETFDQVWTFTGSWTNWPGTGRDGTTGLVDSPADYVPGSTFALAGVDLSATTWPVFKFWDRHSFASDGAGVLEFSSDGGTSWTAYDAVGTRTNWVEQTIDITPLRGLSQVWFRFITSVGSPGDGWYIDDISLADMPVENMYPFLETFEQGLDRWLPGGWVLDDSQHIFGRSSVYCEARGRGPRILSLAGNIELQGTTDPSLTFWIKGGLGGSSSVAAEVSTDDGRNWANLWYQGTPWWTGWSTDWARVQVSLAGYIGQTLRLRFNLSGGGSIWLDNIGVGGPTPEEPVLSKPLQLEVVDEARPKLEVVNAIDYQSDSLTYRYEVYDNAELTGLVAEVPVVASGEYTTGWDVDVNLPNLHQYWWRCRASDGVNIGPWMDTASFFVSLTNHPPATVELVNPPSRWVLANTDGLISWFPTTDPDVGNTVISYHLQVDDDPAFGSPEIDDPNIIASTSLVGIDVVMDALQIQGKPYTNYWAIAVPLKQFAGASKLTVGKRYYWRVRASDNLHSYSEWSAAEAGFWFGLYAPNLRITKVTRNANGTLSLEWTGETAGVIIEHTPTLSPPDWQPLADPIIGSRITLTPDAANPTGFYRLRVDD